MTNTVKDIFKKCTEICEEISVIKNDPVSVCVVADMLAFLASTAAATKSDIADKITDEVKAAAIELSMDLILDSVKDDLIKAISFLYKFSNI